MPDRAEHAPPPQSLVLRLSVPSHGDMSGIAGEVAAKLAEYVGSARLQRAASEAMASLAARVAPQAGEAEIAFEFHRRNGELVVEAECGGRSSEVRYPIA